MKLQLLLSKLLFISIIGILFASCDEVITTTNENQINGAWKCNEQHEEDGQNYYDVEIEVDESDSSTIYIYNFLNLESNPSSPVYVRAKLQGNNITINEQIVAGHTVEGSGTINSDYTKIYLDFTDDLYGGSPWNVSATYTKY